MGVRGNGNVGNGNVMGMGTKMSFPLTSNWHQLHGTICLHIFVVVPLCRSFYLNSSLTFSLPVSSLVISSHISHMAHTLFRFKSFSFWFLLLFSILRFYLSLMSLCLARWRPIWWWGALANRFDFIWFEVKIRIFCSLTSTAPRGA